MPPEPRVLDPYPSATRAEGTHTLLTEARAMVVEDPYILGATPVIRGTRIPVHDVAASVAAGVPRDDIRQAYPDLDDRSIELAAIYAEATPARSAREAIDLPPGARVIIRRRVPRRKVA